MFGGWDHLVMIRQYADKYCMAHTIRTYHRATKEHKSLMNNW